MLRDVTAAQRAIAAGEFERARALLERAVHAIDDLTARRRTSGEGGAR